MIHTLQIISSTIINIQSLGAINLDFTKQSKLYVNISDYIKVIVKEFPEEPCSSNYPWNENLLKLEAKSPELTEDKRALFH
jgi:hypothetical protein